MSKWNESRRHERSDLKVIEVRVRTTEMPFFVTSWLVSLMPQSLMSEKGSIIRRADIWVQDAVGPSR